MENLRPPREGREGKAEALAYARGKTGLILGVVENAGRLGDNPEAIGQLGGLMLLLNEGEGRKLPWQGATTGIKDCKLRVIEGNFESFDGVVGVFIDGKLAGCTVIYSRRDFNEKLDRFVEKTAQDWTAGSSQAFVGALEELSAEKAGLSSLLPEKESATPFHYEAQARQYDQGIWEAMRTDIPERKAPREGKVNMEGSKKPGPENTKRIDFLKPIIFGAAAIVIAASVVVGSNMKDKNDIGKTNGATAQTAASCQSNANIGLAMAPTPIRCDGYTINMVGIGKDYRGANVSYEISSGRLEFPLGEQRAGGSEQAVITEDGKFKMMKIGIDGIDYARHTATPNIKDIGAVHPGKIEESAYLTGNLAVAVIRATAEPAGVGKSVSQLLRINTNVGDIEEGLVYYPSTMQFSLVAGIYGGGFSPYTIDPKFTVRNGDVLVLLLEPYNKELIGRVYDATQNANYSGVVGANVLRLPNPVFTLEIDTPVPAVNSAEFKPIYAYLPASAYGLPFGVVPSYWPLNVIGHAYIGKTEVLNATLLASHNSCFYGFYPWDEFVNLSKSSALSTLERSQIYGVAMKDGFEALCRH